MTNDTLKKLCEEFYAQGKLDKQYAIVFVYNSASLVDETHSTECITPIELDMIMNSFKQIALCVYSYNSEQKFIDSIAELKSRHLYIMVYSMAQNINGVGRRTFVPLLCKYYNILNISSDEYASFLSGDKKLMHTLLQMDNSLNFPKTYHFNKNNISTLEKLIYLLPTNKYIIKPNDESASIGVKLLNLNCNNRKKIYSELMFYYQSYSNFCIQEYIDGVEIEVPLVKFDDFYCPGICELVFDKNLQYLDYDTIGLDGYKFKTFTFNTEIVTAAINVAKKLNFNCISRIDFKVCNNIPYIIDIGANPTVSTNSSTNYLFKQHFGKESSIYHVLVIRTLMHANLFKPSFNYTK